MDAFTHVPVIPEHVELEYQTTGPCGGDAGHGGVTTLTLKFDSGATNLVVRDWRGDVVFRTDEPVNLELQVLGDWEMEGLDRALKRLGLHLAQRDTTKETA
jgi:hypothetical protein